VQKGALVCPEEGVNLFVRFGLKVPQEFADQCLVDQPEFLAGYDKSVGSYPWHVAAAAGFANILQATKTNQAQLGTEFNE